MATTQDVIPRLSVLIVEEDALIVEELRSILNRLRHRVAGAAETAEQAIALSRQTSPDVILIGDVNKANADELRPLNIPLVYLATPSDAVALAQSSPDAPSSFVLMPVAERELGVALEIAVRRSRTDRNPLQTSCAAILAGIADAVIATDTEGCIRFMNPMAETLTGWRQEDRIGQPIEDALSLVPEPDTSSAHVLVRRAITERGTICPASTALLATRDGCRLPIEYRAAPLLNLAGEVTGVVVTIRDASERRRAEEALRESDTFLRMSQQAGRCGSYEWDLTTNRVRWSEELCRIHGLEPGEANGLMTDTLRFIHPDDLPLLQERIGNLLDGGDSHPLNYRIRLPDGTERRLWGRGVVVPDTAGQARKVIGTVVDVTEHWSAELEREVAETALRDSDEFNRQIVSSTQAGLVVLDSHLHYRLWNPKMEETTGLRPEDVLGKSPLEIFPSLEATEAYHQLERALTGETTTSVDLPFDVPISGRAGWLWQIAGPLRNSRNEIIGVLASVLDVTERHRNQQQLQRQFDRLDAQRVIDLSIIHNRDMLTTLRLVLEKTIALLEADAAAILLPNRETESLEYAVFQGFPGGIIPPPPVDQKNEPATRAAEERRRVTLEELPDGGLEFRKNLSEYGRLFDRYYAVPLIADNVVHGVLEVYARSGVPIDSIWLESLDSLAAQAAIAAHHSTLLNDLERANEEMLIAHDATITGWSRALDLRDKETEGHSERVTAITMRLAKAMGLEGDALVQVRRGALLHDVGKLGIPDNILLKSGPLTEEEWALMKMHPVYAYEMLNPISFLRPALAIPYCHHEKWDGTGYPNGLAGEQIPISARIFALADIFDALCSDRPYRAGLPPDQVREHIRSLSGTHLDPAVVEAFLKLEE